MPKRAKLSSMKTKTLTIRYSDEYAEVVELLKHREGGLTAFIENALSKVKITDDERKALQLLKKFKA